MKETLKNNKGITLVALIITIIILIILAGISIGILTGKDGIITKAQQAKQNMENATLEEQEQMNTLYDRLATGIGPATSYDAVAGNNQSITELQNSLETTIDQKIAQKEAEIKLSIYPVGSVYISMDSTNPETLFGGTWQQIGQGKTLVGIDTNDTDFDTVEETGGEKTHTLTIAEMPSHNHSIALYSNGTWNSGGNYVGGMGASTSGPYLSYTEGKGNSQAHNNLQPYIVTYMWKRTA